MCTPPHPETSDSSSLPTTDHEISPVECDFSQLKKGVTVPAQLKSQVSTAEQSALKLVSCYGKVTGHYGHRWNVQDEKGNISSIVFKHDIISVSIIIVKFRKLNKEN